MAFYVIPLVTVPYLSRVLGPSSWGLLAMAQAFAMYGALIVDYGFIFSASRQIVTSSSRTEIENVIADVQGAKLLLAGIVAIGAFLAYRFVPLFREHPLLLSVAVASEVFKAALPTFYFFGIQRVAFASMLDIVSRLAAAAGIFVFVRQPADGWKVFGLNLIGALIALAIGSSVMYSRYSFLWPRLRGSWKMLRQTGAMFLFRSANHIYSLSNAFVLGLFASPRDVGYYAGAEKINSAAIGLLSPLSTALYPRSAALAKESFGKALQLTRVSLFLMLGVGTGLMLLMWFASGFIVQLILGPKYQASAIPFSILSLRAPMAAWTNVLGFQWLLALGLETAFQRIIVVAIALNLSLAAVLAPRFTSTGMAWAVVASQTAVVIGIYFVLQRRKLNPLAMPSKAVHA